MKYVDAKGKEQRPVRCAKLRGGDDHIIGNGWYAVTGNISYASGMIVWGETNLILCGGTNEYALCSAIGRGHKDSNFGTLKLSDNMIVRAGQGFQSAEDSGPALRTSGRKPAKTTGTPTSSPATIQTRPFPTSTTGLIP